MGFNNHNSSGVQRSVKTIDEWCEYIAGGRSKVSRTIGNNTRVRLTANGVAIRLHETDVITLNKDGTVTLNSGGWLTLTTKQRLNEYSNARITQRAGVWYMADGSLFYDGITINADGTPINPRGSGDTEDYERKLKDLKKQAKQYASEYIEAIKRGEIGLPSASDCWGCYFALSNTERVPAESRGKAQPFGTSHLLDHMTEKYYVPSLLVNAGREAGYQDHQIGLMGIGGHRLFIAPERIIYKYLVKHLQGGL
jgi:hypothetical protein